MTGSNSNHVVWFANLDGTAFKNVTVLDGVTIKGGSAQETVGTKENFFGDRGAGVYMAGNAYLTNCVVTENAATGKAVVSTFMADALSVRCCIIMKDSREEPFM